ncbi:ATP-dependent DNA ligase [Methanoregula formicica]|uniref:DNA ligase n=1 Tax=Methanoregula formicica (strain DSM 22288 / NBRC 105244 / SMSP) TaxID=593750 RepID=L0HF16_METFS|nr:ATP-dependent DNA ligase [Methanoregula formicica]AGB01664.1 ATP-dependent DNA ligase I [Methanoregula formicica SMSP]
MRFQDFAQTCGQLEKTSGRLDMIAIISQVLPGLTDEELPVFVRFVMGRIFADWSSRKLGIGPNLLYEAVGYVAGVKKEQVIDKINATGDVGTAVEELLELKSQTTFFHEDLELVQVYNELIAIADTEGKKSQREKGLLVRRLLANALPIEGRYLARIMLEELRIGVGEGSVREAVAKAFGVDSSLVEHAQQALNDMGEVARLAKTGAAALEDVKITLFHPVRMMLAQAGSIAGMIEEHGEIAAEFKYDGSRFQFHKKGNWARLYSRRLEDVTAALPDVIGQLMGATDHDVILDGEVIAIKDGRPMPFQSVLRRFRRRHDVAEAQEKIEMVPNVFDILYLDGETLIDLPFSERRKKLESVMKMSIAPQTVSSSQEIIEKTYNDALAAGHEGIMIKVPSSPYTPGQRGKNWIKIKPEVDTLDLAVIGAEWGEGKRAHVFGSFLVACQNQGKLLPLSRVATGFSDEQLAEVYDLLKDTVERKAGKEVTFEPTLVFEVGYAELQASVNYEAGFALRFPRFIRIRDDKDIADIETIESIRARYQRQVNTAQAYEKN